MVVHFSFRLCDTGVLRWGVVYHSCLTWVRVWVWAWFAGMSFARNLRMESIAIYAPIVVSIHHPMKLQ
jgi:hypothetical protein